MRDEGAVPAMGGNLPPAAGTVALVDAHGHLNHPRFGDDAPMVAEAARRAGVVRLLVPGWDLGSSQRAVALARQLGWVDAAVGIHPHDAAAGEGDWARLEALAEDPAVVAIGETGLDFHRLLAPAEVQLENLERHVELARRTGKPLILHCRSAGGRRDAQDTLLAVLRRWSSGSEARGARGDRPPAVLHSFSGPLDYALAALELGCLLSFSGLVFRAGEEGSAEVARRVPEEALLVETDAPFLAPPDGLRGRNEPARVAVVARWLAEVRGTELGVLGRRLVATYDRMVGTRGSGAPSPDVPPPAEGSPRYPASADGRGAVLTVAPSGR